MYAVIVDVIVTTLGSVYFMLIASSFYGPFITFISLLAVPITAWVGVFLADILRRKRYNPEGLMDLTSGSAYWYRGGFEWRAVTAWAVAIILGYCFVRAQISADTVWFTGPFHDTWLGQNGLGWVVAFVVGGGLYLALGGAKGPDTESTSPTADPVGPSASRR